MKILLSNPAVIGDLILSTSLLPALKRAIPGCRIGFLVGSWAKEVVEDHELVDWIHILDLANQNRSPIGKRAKKIQEKKTGALALKQVRTLQYDVALDLYSYYKRNASYFIYKASIPCRIGYWSSSVPFHYTHPLFWFTGNLHTIENHKRMLLEMGIDEKYLNDFSPHLCYRQELESPIHQGLPKDYILVHMGAGTDKKLWPEANWQFVARYLDEHNYRCVYIGHGQKENGRIERVIGGLKNAGNFCNCFTWKQLIPVVKKARFILGLDSMVAHMAASFAKSGLFIYAHSNNRDWVPYHPNCHTICADSYYYTEKGRQSIYPKEPIMMLSAECVKERLQDLLNREISL